MIRAALISSLLALLAPAQVMSQETDTTYPVVALAGIMGELHYLSFRCEGPGAQDWRETMLEMLEFEAPTRGTFRQRLIDAFNEGFYDQENRRPRCGPETDFQKQLLGERGRDLSELIRRTYVD
jgi:uncharacterized protein (TIGR02301 family)